MKVEYMNFGLAMVSRMELRRIIEDVLGHFFFLNGGPAQCQMFCMVYIILLYELIYIIYIISYNNHFTYKGTQRD